MNEQCNSILELLTDGLDKTKKEIASRMMFRMTQHLLEHRSEYKYNFEIVAYAMIYRLVRDNGEFTLNPTLMYNIYCEVYESTSGEDIEPKACALACEKLKEIMF